MQRQQRSARRGQPLLAAFAGILLAGLLPQTPLAAEWSRSVTVNPEVLASLPASGQVPPLPLRRGPPQSASSVEYRWDLLADLGPGASAAGGGGGGAGWGTGYGKAAPALIRPGEPPQWIVGTGAR